MRISHASTLPRQATHCLSIWLASDHDPAGRFAERYLLHRTKQVTRENQAVATEELEATAGMEAVKWRPRLWRTWPWTNSLRQKWFILRAL